VCPEEGSSMLLHNIGDYVESYPRRQESSQSDSSLPQKPQISYMIQPVSEKRCPQFLFHKYPEFQDENKTGRWKHGQYWRHRNFVPIALCNKMNNFLSPLKNR
jgi:hypothetical protein